MEAILKCSNDISSRTECQVELKLAGRPWGIMDNQMTAVEAILKCLNDISSRTVYRVELKLAGRPWGIMDNQMTVVEAILECSNDSSSRTVRRVERNLLGGIGTSWIIRFVKIVPSQCSILPTWQLLSDSTSKTICRIKAEICGRNR